MAHSALGIVALKTGDDAAAEHELKLSTDLNQSQPDPYLWYHLALAQDHQKKYPEALASINRALQAIGANADLGELARGEQKRLLTRPATPPRATPARSRVQFVFMRAEIRSCVRSRHGPRRARWQNFVLRAFS